VAPKHVLKHTIYDSIRRANCEGRSPVDKDVSLRQRGWSRRSRDMSHACIVAWLSSAVVDLHVTSCPSSGGVTIATAASRGYVSNTLYEAYSSLGWYSCPWIIQAQRGQRLQLTLITLQASTTMHQQLQLQQPSRPTLVFTLRNSDCNNCSLATACALLREID